MVRGRPRYLDPQLNQGEVRFASKRGFGFTSLLPDNKYILTENAFKDSDRVTLSSRPGWFQVGCLIRIGPSEEVGELQLIQDLIDSTSIETRSFLVNNYNGGENISPLNYVTLYGTPMNFFAVSSAPHQRKILLMESWYKMVPGDTILISPTPDVLETLSPFTVTKASLLGTRAGTPSEPTVIYRYEIEVETDSNLVPFVPTAGLPAYLKANPLYQRGDFGNGDLKIPSNVGPCLVDYFAGGLLYTNKVDTLMGLKTWDAFGLQTNLPLTNNQQWQMVPSNYLLLERPIRSDTFVFWQRIKGKFQLQKRGFFQAELASNGEFIMSSDLLVPEWPSDRQHGWVIPVISQGPCTISVQFEPQERQYFQIPANTLTFIRPKLVVDPTRTPIGRIVFAIKGSPNSRVEIRTWEYDGPAVLSLSYSLLGTKEAFGIDRWLAGGFCVKPLFYNTDVLTARYSDGVSRYNAGYIYV